MTMKSVLMIAHGFPPEGNAGSFRTLRFVRCLPHFGWNPIVISLATDSYERYDPKLLLLVPSDTRVIRVGNPDPLRAFQEWRGKRIQRIFSGASSEKADRIRAAHQASFRSWIRNILRNAETWIYHPDADMGWIRPAVKASLKCSDKERPAVIWATAGPVSSLVVAEKVSGSTGIPYVLDFRDAWTITYNDFEDRRPAWAKRYEERRMYRLLEKAQSVIVRFHAEAECYYRAYKGALEPSKIYIIPNGYEGAIDEFLPPEGDRCEVLYTGTLSDYRYDSLLEALSSLKHSSPELASRLHLHFVGEGTESIAHAAAAVGLSDMITAQRPIPQEEIIELSKRAHALLILGRPSTMRGYELFAAAKLYGYLKAGMPIIGVLPPDETRKLLLQVGVKTVADFDSQSQITAALRTLLDAWSEHKLSSLLPNRIACERYSVDRQSQELVRALEGVPAVDPFVPGAAEVPISLRAEISNRALHFEQPKSLGTGQDVVTRSHV